MSLANPQKFIIKNKNSENNLEYLNKKPNLDFKTSFKQNSLNTPISKLNFQNISNNNFKGIKISSEQKENKHNLYQTSATPNKIENLNINIENYLNIPINIQDNFLLKKNKQSLYHQNNIINENNLIQNNNNNKLIKPTFYFDQNNLNKFQNNIFPLNKSFQTLNADQRKKMKMKKSKEKFLINLKYIEQNQKRREKKYYID